jgi:hypothetical protein
MVMLRNRGVHPCGRVPEVLLAVAIALLAAGTARAQTGDSVIQGKVNRADNKLPIEAVLVTVTSPALQGSQSVVTDASGFYRVPNLPPGTYTVRVDREEHSSSETAGVQVRAGQTIQLNMAMVPATVAATEQVTLTAEAPTVDIGSSSVSTTISDEMVKRVPLSRPSNKGAGVRSFEAMAEAAPEAKNDLFGTSVAGTTSPENRYIVDGLSVNNTAYGLGGTPLSSEFVKEINVITGGYLPEYGRATGGILSVSTKTGSNKVASSAWAFLTPGVLQGSQADVFREGNTIAYDQPKITFLTDVGADVGLPLIKDKLWLYAGFDYAYSGYDIRRALYQTQVANGAPQMDAEGHVLRDEIPGTSRNYDATGWTAQFIGKLSYAPTNDHALSLTTIVAPLRSGGRGKFGVDPEQGRPDPPIDSIGAYEAYGYAYANDAIDNLLKWTASSSGKRFVLDTTFGWHHETKDELPNDGSEVGSATGLANRSRVAFRRNMPLHPVTDFESVPAGYCVEPDPSKTVVCPVTTYSADSVGFIRQALLDRYQLRSMGTLLASALGHHVIKAGIDVEYTSYDSRKGYAGANLYRENTAGTSFSDSRNFGYLTAPDTPNLLTVLKSKTSQFTVGGFLQNNWSVMDKVTLNAGLRYDAQYLFNSEGSLGLVLANQWSPRLGFIWDPTRKGRSRLFGSYARYYQSVPLDLADRALSGEPQIVSSRRKTVCDPRDPAQAKGKCRELGNLSTLNGPEDPNQKYALSGGGTVPVDPDIVAPSTDELLFGAEAEFFIGSRFGLTYSRRRLNDIIEDMSTDEATTYFLGNPGRGIATSFPKPQRNYDAFTLYFQRNFLKSWLAQASYTLSWLKGNYSGLFRPETEQLDPNITSDFDLASLLDNRTGYLPGDRRHQFKVFGAKDFALAKVHHIMTGVGGRLSSGEPTSFVGSHQIYLLDEVFISERGSGPRLPWNGSVDVQLGYNFDFTKDFHLAAVLDVFNLLNFQETTQAEVRYTTSDVLPTPGLKGKPDPSQVKRADGEEFTADQVNPNVGKPLRTQPPRIFRFGLRGAF